jgi:hypothetical protein
MQNVTCDVRSCFRGVFPYILTQGREEACNLSSVHSVCLKYLCIQSGTVTFEAKLVIQRDKLTAPSSLLIAFSDSCLFNSEIYDYVRG